MHTNTMYKSQHNSISYVSETCTSVLASKCINNPLAAGLRGSVTGFRGGRRGKGKRVRKGSEDMEGKGMRGEIIPTVMISKCRRPYDTTTLFAIFGPHFLFLFFTERVKLYIPGALFTKGRKRWSVVRTVVC